MTTRLLGPVVTDWTPPPHPRGVVLQGAFCRLRPLRPAEDAAALFDAVVDSPWVWDYLGEPPPPDPAAMESLLAVWAAMPTAEIFAILPRDTQVPKGYACLMNVNSAAGDIEIGNVNLSPALQRTPAATEAFSLMLGWAFDNGYRRVTWKCNSLNVPSRRAAQRLGFGFEGLFRKHLIVKGRNRDTAWFGMTDDDWTGIGPAHAAWCAPENFDPDGRQRRSLRDLTAPFVLQTDPTL